MVPGTTLVAKEILQSLLFVRTLHLIGAGFDTQDKLCVLYEEFYYLNSLSSSTESQLEEIVETAKVDFIFSLTTTGFCIFGIIILLAKQEL